MVSISSYEENVDKFILRYGYIQDTGGNGKKQIKINVGKDW